MKKEEMQKQALEDIENGHAAEIHRLQEKVSDPESSFCSLVYHCVS